MSLCGYGPECSGWKETKRPYGVVYQIRWEKKIDIFNYGQTVLVCERCAGMARLNKLGPPYPANQDPDGWKLVSVSSFEFGEIPEPVKWREASQ